MAGTVRIINTKPFRELRNENPMVNCPICGKELKKPAPGGWRCECGEVIPFQYATSHDAQCCCGTNHHH
jgi:hypothetical protein